MERSAALLTKSQREGLLDDLGTNSADRKLRQRIRKRARDSTVDLRLLFSRMDDDDIRKAFHSDLSPLEEEEHRISKIEELLYDATQELGRIPRRLGELEDLSHAHRDLVEDLEAYEADLDEYSEQSQDQALHADSQDQLEALQDDVENLEDEFLEVQQEIVNQTEILLDEINEVYDRFSEMLQQLEILSNSFPKLRLLLDDDYDRFQEIIDRVRTEVKDFVNQLKSSRRQLETIRETFSIDAQLRGDTIRQDVDPLNVVSELIGPIEKFSDKFGRGPRHRRRHNREEPGLHYARRLLHHNRQSLSFSLDMRDNVVKTIGFYLRVSDLVGADLESVLEDAVTATMSRHNEGAVLDSVSVNIDAENRDTAIERGREKLGKQRLSNAELRAVVESDPELLADVDGVQDYAIQDRILERLLENPDQVEEGLTFTEIEPEITYQDVTVHIDLLGEGSDGTTTLVDIEPDPSDDLTDELERMRLLLDAVEEPDDDVRGYIVVPRAVTDGKRADKLFEAPHVSVYFA